MAIKLKWKVSSVPTGRYRSFDHRAWPDATYPNGKSAASIGCTDDYTAQRAKGVDAHAELTVRIAFHHPRADRAEKGGRTWRTLKTRFETLAEAKKAAQVFIDGHSEVWPKVEQTEVATKLTD